MARLLGERYVWLRNFGNRNYKGTFGPIDQIEIVNFEAGVKSLHELTGQPFEGAKNVVLMCGCRDPNECHRKVLAELLAALWQAQIVHLEVPARVKTPAPNGLFPAPGA